MHVRTAEDLYLFFLAHQRDVTPTAPVARHTLGGWTWQTLDSISTSIRRKVMLLDIGTGCVINGMGEQFADLHKLKEHLPDTMQVVSFSCQLEGNTIAGLLGEVASREKVSPPLQYTTLYYYSAKRDEIPQITPLGPVTDGPLPNIDNPTLASKALPGQNTVITYGKPVSEGIRVWYWYCIQQKEQPTYRVYILAYFDGRQTIAIDGYIVNPPDIRYWNSNIWVKERQQLEWAYQPQLSFSVQPIVGKGATGNIISYRPPELWRIAIVHDADKAQQ